MIKLYKEFIFLSDNMNVDREIKEPVPVENVPPNSAIKLTNPTQCLRVKWDGEMERWVGFGMEPYMMHSGAFMITHVLPELEYLKEGRLNVLEWQSQIYELEGFAPTVFVISEGMGPDTYVVLKSGSEVANVGIGYLMQAERIGQTNNMVLVLRNDGEGQFSTIYLQLPYDLKDVYQ